ncbi:MAG: DUF4469 domain-containing protein [Treponema sp.]|nr:DUF4469 domain-containing protein [Treponema sp.]
MRQELIDKKDIEPKSGRLPIALYPNDMFKSGNSGYYARVVNRVHIGMDDILNDMRSEGSGLDSAEFKKLWDAAVNAIAMRLREGISVDFGLGTLYPAVKGSFASEQAGFTSGRNRLTVRYRPSQGIEKTMTALSPVIRCGNSWHPEITRIKDHGSGWDSVNQGNCPEGVLSRGNILLIEGKMLRIAGESGTNGLFFDSVRHPGKSVMVGEASLCRNQGTILECIIPHGLEAGERYRIRVVTRFLHGSRLRRKPLSCTSPITFTAS